MNLKIIAVGKIKEEYSQKAIEDFKKRLGKFCSISVVEIPAEKILSENLAQKYKQIEAEKISQQIKPNSYVVALEIAGEALCSEGLAEKVSELTHSGYGEVVFIIGGANGIHSSLSKTADMKLSFSKLTFPHQIMRLILLEQLYRAFKILNNEPYHR